MSDSDSKPPHRLPRPSGTYSITRKGEPAAAVLTVTAGGQEVEIRLDDQVLRMSRADARRLLATLLEKLG